MSRLIRTMLSVSLLLIGFQATARSNAQDSDEIVHPLITTDLYSWYENLLHSDERTQSVELEPTYTGVYVMAALDDTLYLGLNSSVPKLQIQGTVLAAVDDQGLRLVNPLNEQGITRIKVIGDKLFIPGYDPNESWDAGNLYIYTPGEDLEKLRYRFSTPQFVTATTTDGNGHYKIAGLRPTAYSVKFIPPEGYYISNKAPQASFSFDSNPDPRSGLDYLCNGLKYLPLKVNGLFEEMSIDAGMFMPAEGEQLDPVTIEPNMSETDTTFFGGHMAIGDLVWVDANRNGVQDEGERGLGGVRVEVYTKEPYFPCIIHANAVWGDEQTGKIYYNGGLYAAFGFGNTTFVSEDFGQTWTGVSRSLDYYWARDLIYFNGYFYKTHRKQILDKNKATYQVISEIQFSEDLVTWQAVPLPAPPSQSFEDVNGATWTVDRMIIDETDALTIFQNQLIVLDAAGEQLYSISGGENYTTIPIVGADLSGIFPEFHEPDFPVEFPNDVTGATNRYNTLANANDELLYAIGGDNALYATPDLQQWFKVADFGEIDQGAPMIALAYWQNKGWLAIATAGEHGGLYYVEHAHIVDLINQGLLDNVSVPPHVTSVLSE